MQFIYQIHCSISLLLNLVRCDVQILCTHQGTVPIPFLPWFISETSPFRLCTFHFLCLFPATVCINPPLEILCFWNSHTYQAFLYLSTVAHTVLLSEMLISNLCLLKFSLSCKSQFKWLLLWSLTSLLLPIWHPVFLLLRALLFSFWVSCPLHFQSMRFSWGQLGMDVWCGSANHYTTWQWLAQT